MQERAAAILQVFPDNQKGAGDTLPKGVVLDRIKSLGMEIAEVRDLWHLLIGQGLLRQIGDEIELTAAGADLL